MNTIKPEDKTIAVAHFVADTAHESGAQFTTSNEGLANALSRVLAQMTHETDTEVIRSYPEQVGHSFGDKQPSIQSWTYFMKCIELLPQAWEQEEELQLSEAWGETFNELKEFTLSHYKASDLNYFTKFIN